jgi:O-antigen/teichoic acid export membrane protein
VGVFAQSLVPSPLVLIAVFRSAAASRWLHQSSPVWAIGQLVVVRLFITLKFLWIAAIVGPEVVGNVSLALLVLVIAEALLETGLLQAAVQSSRTLTREDAGAWITLQAFRGLVIACLIGFGAPILAVGMGAPQATVYIQVIAVVAVIKATFSPGLANSYRGRNFRALFFIDVFAALLDLAFSVAMLRAGYPGYVVIIGTALSESFKSVCSWIFFGLWGRPSFKWSNISWLTNYGKWVWKSSVFIAVLNQADKILVSRLLGVHELGVYQVAYKMAQLALTDLPGAYAQYLFPTLSRLFREARSEVRRAYIRVLGGVLSFLAVSAGLIVAGAMDLLIIVLGKDWHESMSLVRWLIVPMSLGAIIAVQVSFARAIGAPQVVAAATQWQFITVIFAAPLGIVMWGLPGLTVGLTIAAGVAVVLIELNTRRVLRA